MSIDLSYCSPIIKNEKLKRLLSSKCDDSKEVGELTIDILIGADRNNQKVLGGSSSSDVRHKEFLDDCKGTKFIVNENWVVYVYLMKEKRVN